MRTGTSILLQLFLWSGLVLAKMPIETQSTNDAKWQWVTKNNYRVVMKCRGTDLSQQHRIAWAQFDLEDFYKDASSSKCLFNPDSVRVVEYDVQTGKPVKYDNSLSGEQAYYVPAKIDEWPRRHLTLQTIRKPQLSWIRRNGDDAQAVYICYFDFTGSGETKPFVMPAYIGTGDALSFATPSKVMTLRGRPLIFDWDGDGDNDIIAALGMVPETTVYFYENTGDSFNTAFAKPISICPKGTKWYSYSRGTQVLDINGDGKLDIAGNEGYYDDVQGNGFYKWVVSSCPMDSEVGQIMKDSRRYKWYIVDWDGDGIKDLLASCSYWKEYGWSNAFDTNGQWTNGPLRGWFYFFKNTALSNREFKFAEPVQLHTVDGNVAEVYGYADLVVEDFTGDGLPDIVVGDFIDNINIFVNIGSKDKPLLAPRERLMTTDGLFVADYQASSVSAVDYDNDGDVDLFIRGENDAAGLVENTGKLTKDGSPVFKPTRYLQSYCDYPVESELPVSSICDWDKDGDWDLIFGNSPGEIGWYECESKYPKLKFANRKLFEDSHGPIRIIAGFNGSIQGPAEKLWGYTVPNGGDWDGDGYPDIMLNSIWGSIEWYKNPGQLGASRLKDAQHVQVQWEGDAPKPEWRWWNPEPKQWSTQWRSTVEMIDWDRDGLMDVAALDWEGYLVLHKRYIEDGELKLSPGKRMFLDEQGQPWHINPKKPGGCGRRKFTFADWDNDGDRDFIVDDKTFGGNVLLYLNITDDQKPQFAAYGPLCDIIVSGHTCSPSVFDLEGDGKLDLLMAAEDGHFYCFHRSYIEDKDSLEAKFLNDNGADEDHSNVLLFDEQIANGQIIGGKLDDSQAYLGERSIFAVKEGSGRFNVALDLKGTINISDKRKLVAYIKADSSQKGTVQLECVQMYTIYKSGGGDKASQSQYDACKTEQAIAADFTVDGKVWDCNDGQCIEFANDGKWHVMTLDLNSGPGMPESKMIKPSTILRRLDFVFKSPAKLYIDNVYITD